MPRYVFSLNNSRCSDFVDRIYQVSALGQHEVLCYLSYEVPYLGPEGASTKHNKYVVSQKSSILTTANINEPKLYMNGHFLVP
jgi:hypothetical protein